ncbi:MAG: hypothetical protein PVG66_07645 [Chromatiales bacterium]
MSIYSADKLIAQARILAAEFRQTMGKPLPGVSNEIAEHDAIRLLELEPKPEGAVGYDAVDPRRNNLRVQIKSRAIFGESKSGERMGQLNLNQEWDLVVLVIMDEQYMPVEIFEAYRDDVEEHVYESDSNRAKRGALSVAKFRKIARLAWSREQGLIAE